MEVFVSRLLYSHKWKSLHRGFTFTNGSLRIAFALHSQMEISVLHLHYNYKRKSLRRISFTIKTLKEVSVSNFHCIHAWKSLRRISITITNGSSWITIVLQSQMEVSSSHRHYIHKWNYLSDICIHQLTSPIST